MEFVVYDQTIHDAWDKVQIVWTIIFSCLEPI